ncbi:MAG: RidA family protein [Planctomycetota bacterium]|nr:RidA family protein [Planctomycetota bacterium]
MAKRIISAAAAPKAIGPYSQAVAAGEWVFVSGQIPIDPATGTLVGGDIRAATEQALQNLAAILSAAGLGLEDVVKTTVYLENLDDFAAMNEIYAKFFPAAPPARACVQAARLPKGAAVEIEAVAWRQPKRQIRQRCPQRRRRK